MCVCCLHAWMRWLAWYWRKIVFNVKYVRYAMRAIPTNSHSHLPAPTRHRHTATLRPHSAEILNTFAYKIPFISAFSLILVSVVAPNRSTSTIRFNIIMHPENKTRTLSTLRTSHIFGMRFSRADRIGIWHVHERRRVWCNNISNSSISSQKPHAFIWYTFGISFSIHWNCVVVNFVKSVYEWNWPHPHKFQPRQGGREWERESFGIVQLANSAFVTKIWKYIYIWIEIVFGDIH